jgi:hypothetical protein
MNINGSADVGEIKAAISRIKPLLAGRQPPIQSAILADLFSTWLAGHHVDGDSAATRTLRAEMLAEWLVLVDRLVPINAKRIGATQ